MKTNVNMIRNMGNYKITQRTSDGMFNATHLLNQWNYNNKMKKQMIHFMENKSTQDFIEVLENENDIKERNSVVLQSRGRNGGTWMHPYLFIDFAMWLNPKFKLDVIRFVYDQLIEYRHSAGDYYKGLTSAIQRFNKVNYVQLAKGLNHIVFGKHEPQLRQKATKEQLHELTELQKQLAFAIDMGYIRSFDELISEMRRLWNMKHFKFINR